MSGCPISFIIFSISVFIYCHFPAIMLDVCYYNFCQFPYHLSLSVLISSVNVSVFCQLSRPCHLGLSLTLSFITFVSVSYPVPLSLLIIMVIICVFATS